MIELKVTMPILTGKDGDEMLPPDISAMMKTIGIQGAHFFGEGSPREVTFFCENEKLKTRLLARLTKYNAG